MAGGVKKGKLSFVWDNGDPVSLMAEFDSDARAIVVPISHEMFEGHTQGGKLYITDAILKLIFYGDPNETIVKTAHDAAERRRKL